MYDGIRISDVRRRRLCKLTNDHYREIKDMSMIIITIRGHWSYQLVITYLHTYMIIAYPIVTIDRNHLVQMDVYVEHAFLIRHISQSHAPPTRSARTHHTVGSVYISMTYLRRRRK